MATKRKEDPNKIPEVSVRKAFTGVTNVRTPEESTKILEKRLKKREEIEKARQEANKILRQGGKIKPRKVVTSSGQVVDRQQGREATQRAITSGEKSTKQTRGDIAKREKKPVIKIDPSVKPQTGTPGPIGLIVDVARTVRDTFREKSAQAADRLKEAARAESERRAQKNPGIKTVVPMRIKRNFNPFDPHLGTITAQKGFEDLQKQEGIKDKRITISNKRKGLAQDPGQSRALALDLLDKRAAKQARKVNLGGNRSDRSRGGRERPPLIPQSKPIDPKELAKLEKRQDKIRTKDEKSLAGRIGRAALIGAATGAAAARTFGNSPIRRRRK